MIADLEFRIADIKRRLISDRHAGLKDPAPHHDAGGIQQHNEIKRLWIPGLARNDKQ